MRIPKILQAVLLGTSMFVPVACSKPNPQEQPTQAEDSFTEAQSDQNKTISKKSAATPKNNLQENVKRFLEEKYSQFNKAEGDKKQFARYIKFSLDSYGNNELNKAPSYAIAAANSDSSGKTFFAVNENLWNKLLGDKKNESFMTGLAIKEGVHIAQRQSKGWKDYIEDLTKLRKEFATTVNSFSSQEEASNSLSNPRLVNIASRICTSLATEELIAYRVEDDFCRLSGINLDNLKSEYSNNPSALNQQRTVVMSILRIKDRQLSDRLFKLFFMCGIANSMSGENGEGHPDGIAAITCLESLPSGCLSESTNLYELNFKNLAIFKSEKLNFLDMSLPNLTTDKI